VRSPELGLESAAKALNGTLSKEKMDKTTNFSINFITAEAKRLQ
jgi:hypothetical protein